ncbi:MAG: KpsF/GutQ family sugar-phosphate isomerase [Planctomycetes bacterium]|nr:KpsF/GutQ family sugar-phosphate isomerase [Planctomycetota bacterium]
MDLEYARTILRAEAAAILSLLDRVDDNFPRAVGLLLECRGRIVVMGMGKTGIVGRKISATLSSTGAPSLFLHPAEAYHGDLGRVVREDVVLVLSNSGETDEIVRLLPLLRRIGARIVAMTGNARSTLGRNCDVLLDLGQIPEACPLGLAPTASTTALLALGDALALCVLKERGFNQEQYAFFHPGGDLGRKLLKVRELMRTGEKNPVVGEEEPVQRVLLAITGARAGAVSVVGRDGRLAGIFTDGDLRRHVEDRPDLLHVPVRTVMTRTPVTIGPERLASEAVLLLKERRIDELPVVDDAGRPVGMLDVQDLLGVGLV